MRLSARQLAPTTCVLCSLDAAGHGISSCTKYGPQNSNILEGKADATISKSCGQVEYGVPRASRRRQLFCAAVVPRGFVGEVRRTVRGPVDSACRPAQPLAGVRDLRKDHSPGHDRRLVVSWRAVSPGGHNRYTPWPSLPTHRCGRSDDGGREHGRWASARRVDSVAHVKGWIDEATAKVQPAVPADMSCQGTADKALDRRRLSDLGSSD